MLLLLVLMVLLMVSLTIVLICRFSGQTLHQCIIRFSILFLIVILIGVEVRIGRVAGIHRHYVLRGRHEVQRARRVEAAHFGMRLQLALQVANVVDDMLDDLELGQLAVLGHERHQVLELGQIHFHFGIFALRVRVPRDGASVRVDGGHRGTGLTDGSQRLHSLDNSSALGE